MLAANARSHGIGTDCRFRPRGRPVRRGDRPTSLPIPYKLNFLRNAGTKPNNPDPNSNSAAGAGTSAGVFATLPPNTELLVNGVPAPLSAAAKSNVKAP